MSYIPETENRRVDQSFGESRPVLDVEIERMADLAALRQRWSLLPPVPVLAEDRTEGKDQSWAGLDIRTLLRGEQSAGRFAVHSVILAPGAEIATHHHEDAHSIFLVIDGEVEMTIGASVETVGPKSAGFTPPRTSQGLRNTSSSPATVVAIYSPAGAERAFEAAHLRWKETGLEDVRRYADILARHGIHFHDHPLANDERTDQVVAPVELRFAGPGDLERLRAEFLRRPALPRLVRHSPAEMKADGSGSSRRTELLTGDDTGGFAMLNLLNFAPGRSAPDHHQPTEEEFFFILSGSLQMTCATETRALERGAFAFCPRNCTHGFVNASDDEIWFATLNSPAGHERAMAAVRERMAHGAGKDEIYDLAVAGGFIFHSADITR